MKNRLAKSSIEIRRSTISGYGVFATKDFKKNEIIEECPVLLLNSLPVELKDYSFCWNNEQPPYAVPLGCGCLYNHAELPNVECEQDEKNQLMRVKALKNIYKGDEIFTYYSPTWFASRGIKQKTFNYLPKNLVSFLGRGAFILILFFIFKTALFYQLQQKTFTPLTTEHSRHNPKITFTGQKQDNAV